MLLPRSLSHHTPRGTPQHPPVDLRLSLFYPFPPSLSHLLYHQADNAAGLSAWHSTSLPMSRFPRSLSVSLQSFFLSLSLPLSRHLLPPLLSWCHWLLFSRRLRWRVPRDDTQYLKAGTGRETPPLHPPSLTQPKSHLSFSAQSSSLWLRSSTEAANSYNLNLKHTGAKSFPLLSLTTLADTNGMKLSALYGKSKFGAVTCSDSHCNVFLETQGISVTWCSAPWNMHPSGKSISTFPPSPSCTHLLQKTVSDSFLISVSYIYSISAPLRERPPLPLDKWGSCVCICVGSEPEQTGRGGLQHRVKTCNACSLVSSTEHHVYKLLKPLVINCKLKMSSFRKCFFHH